LPIVFWGIIDATDKDRQICEGNQYRTAILFYDEEPRRSAEQSKAATKQPKRFK
jgi:peptide methionine sulfoxide reductase MsrA